MYFSLGLKLCFPDKTRGVVATRWEKVVCDHARCDYTYLVSNDELVTMTYHLCGYLPIRASQIIGFEPIISIAPSHGLLL